MRFTYKQVRFPLPLKVLLSYLLVVLVGALPTYIALHRLFEQQLTANVVQRITARAQLISGLLEDREPVRVLHDVRLIASSSVERVTLIDNSGRVLYDSAAPDLQHVENHLNRHEVQEALGRVAPSETFDPHLPHIGLSRRVSETTGIEMLYVAACIRSSTHECLNVVRLAVPNAGIKELAGDMLRDFRNSLAAAVSVAIALSVVAAVTFVRPLQKLAKRARTIASGDYTASPIITNQRDEIGDVAGALDHLAQELRKRLAGLQTSEAILSQLVEGMHLPMLLVRTGGTIISANASMRALFPAPRETVSEAKIEAFAKSQDFTQAATMAVASGDSVRVIYGVPEIFLEGLVHAVASQGQDVPLLLFCANEDAANNLSITPRAHEVKTLSLPKALRAAWERTRSNGGDFPWGDVPDMLLSEAQGRVILALSLILANVRDFQPKFSQSRTRVSLSLSERLPPAVLDAAEAIVAPLGGSARVRRNRTELLLPKA